MNEWTSNALLGKGSYVKGALSDCSEYFVRIGGTVIYFFLSWLNTRSGNILCNKYVLRNY